MSSQILIRIVDDDCAMREALSFLLESEGWTVAAYGSAEEFLINDAPSQAGCLVLDIKMDGMSGVELQAEMLRRGYNIPIIFLTGHGTIDMAVHAVQRGALDFLQKPLDNARFLEAVKKAITRSVSGFKYISHDSYEAIKLWNELTEREKEITVKISSGLLNKDIAYQLNISVRTVEHHRSRAFYKLGIKDVAELNSLLALIPDQLD